MHPTLRAAILTAAIAALQPSLASADDIESEPINYTTAQPENPVTRLQKRLDAGHTALDQLDMQPFLRALLREFNIPESSQVLVFSRTSLQRQRIAPKTPRAIYFNDEIYLGCCQNSNLLEVAAVDPNLGAVFYTLDRKPGLKPRFLRQNHACLSCHGSSLTRGMPGHLVRSVFPDADGYPILSLGSYRTDHQSPLAERWGGWYVTGTSGKQKHFGNRAFQENDQGDRIPQGGAGHNITNLSHLFPTANYLTPHSDIVALMVLEHQTEMQNLITRAAFQTRIALHQQTALNKELGRAPDYISETTQSRIRSAGDPLLKYLLFSSEAGLSDNVTGTSGFSREFARQGPRDPKGRSLRDLDLARRLFKYPCSYLIYSTQFDALPQPVKDYVLQRLWEVLTNQDSSAAFAHLDAADRQAVLEILLATKPNLPDYWRRSAS